MFVEEVERVIEGEIQAKKCDLAHIKGLIFRELHDQLPHPADVKLVETGFINILLDFARIEYEEIFDQKSKDNHFVAHFMSQSDQIKSLKDLKLTVQAMFYADKLSLYSVYIDEYNLENFIANLKAYFWRKILEESKERNDEVEMLKYLTVCFQVNAINNAVHEKLKAFKENCAHQSRTGCYLKNLFDSVNINGCAQLQQFIRSVKALQSDYLLLEEKFLQIIGFYLSPIEITVNQVGNRSVIEIIGGIIYLSKQLPEVQNKILLTKNEGVKIDEIRIIAVHMLEIDCSLPNSQWHGFNVVIMAANVHISTTCEWDVSGKTSQVLYKKAENGRDEGKDGNDGIDGCAGESSGNVLIIAEKMKYPDRLTVILSGGDGSGGQDGGDGAKGKDGTGISMNKLNKDFPSPIHFLGRFHNAWDVFNKVKDMGRVKKIWKTSGINAYVEVELDDGQKIIHSISKKYMIGNCYLLYKGSKGRSGGRGGLNGLGGEGGYKGECTVISRQNERFPVNVKRKEGKEGELGKSGSTGEYGKNGWDVGYTDFQNWSSKNEKGGNHNMCLSMEYSTDSSKNVYCAYKCDVEGSSKFYAFIKSSNLEHRILTESEKSRETKKHGKRRKEAMATRKSAIQHRAIEKSYGAYFEKSDNLFNEVSEMHTTATAKFDIMQKKAKKAFEEVEALKERSREKVSRYQIYEAEKRAKKMKNAEKMSETPENRKAQIQKKIKEHPDQEETWAQIFTEEFSQEELQKIEASFNSYQQQRIIKTTEVQRVQEKIGLAKFQGAINELNQFEKSESLKCTDYSNYLIRCSDSNSNPEWLMEFQNNIKVENIQNTFNNLLAVAVSDAVTNKFNEISAIKIESMTLKQLIEDIKMNDDDEFRKEKLDILRSDSDGWEIFSSALKFLKVLTDQNEELKVLIPQLNEKELNDNEKLFKYLFDLNNKMCFIITAKNTLAKIVEMFIIEESEAKNLKEPRIQKCVQDYNNFMKAKEQSLSTILQAVRSLSKRSGKASWLKQCNKSIRSAHKSIRSRCPSEVKSVMPRWGK